MLYAKPYWVYAVINNVFNILVKVFSQVSFLVLVPILKIVFKYRNLFLQLPTLGNGMKIKKTVYL
jgi:hypothetical protein